jgi:hypothetical protein
MAAVREPGSKSRLQRINPGERWVSHGVRKCAPIPLSHISLFAAGVSTPSLDKRIEWLILPLGKPTFHN